MAKAQLSWLLTMESAFKHQDLPMFYPKLNMSNFHPLAVVGRGSETQQQVVENYSYLFNLRPHILKS